MNYGHACKEIDLRVYMRMFLIFVSLFKLLAYLVFLVSLFPQVIYLFASFIAYSNLFIFISFNSSCHLTCINS